MARYRQPLAAACAAVAVAATIQALAPPEPPTQDVLVAARDLAAGERLGHADVRAVAWPRGTAPQGVLARAKGRILASPLRAGEPVTDARVAGPGLLAGQPEGTVAVPVRLADPHSAVLVRSGDRVDVLAGAAADVGDASMQEAHVVASRALVLTSSATAGGSGSPWESGGVGDALGGLTGSGPATDDSAGAGLLVLAVDRITATRLATAAGRHALSIALRG